MAESLMKDKTSKTEVRSAGIFAADHQQTNAHAITVLKEKGIKTDHLSQPVTHQLLEWATLVLTMTIQHKQSLIMQFPQYQEKYYTLKEYVSTNDNNVWSELKEAYAKYEHDRTQFIRENEHKYDNNLLDKMVMRKFQSNIDYIQQLEGKGINEDISDPFGGSLSDYQETLAELDTLTSELIEKIKRQS